MIKEIEEFNIYVTISDGNILSYDKCHDTQEIDFRSEGILKEVSIELGNAIEKALKIPSVTQYNINIVEE